MDSENFDNIDIYNSYPLQMFRFQSLNNLSCLHHLTHLSKDLYDYYFQKYFDSFLPNLQTFTIIGFTFSEFEKPFDNLFHKKLYKIYKNEENEKKEEEDKQNQEDKEEKEESDEEKSEFFKTAKGIKKMDKYVKTQEVNFLKEQWILYCRAHSNYMEILKQRNNNYMNNNNNNNNNKIFSEEQIRLKADQKYPHVPFSSSCCEIKKNNDYRNIIKYNLIVPYFNLLKLTVVYCEYISTEWIIYIKTRFPNLQCLEIVNCSVSKNEELEDINALIYKSFPKLKFLHISFTENIYVKKKNIKI